MVIVGGGFAGLYAATYLGRSESVEEGRLQVTLVDQKNYFTFTPLLAEVAGGTLRREHVTYPLRVMARRYGFSYRRAEVTGVDRDRGIVRTGAAEPIPYDYLVLAIGSRPQYFGNGELERGSVPFTTARDAEVVRSRIINAFEAALHVVDDEEELRRLTTFVVAGAGPAGVELASEIRGLVERAVSPYYPALPEPRIVLADGNDRILVGWDAELARSGLDRLRDRGIDVRLNTRITGVAGGSVMMRDPDGDLRVDAHHLFWTAGTRPTDWLASIGLPTENGRLVVGDDLRVKGSERIFAAGDAAYAVDARTGVSFPPVAPIAISQGVRCAGNIESLVVGRPLEPYHAHHAGKIVSLGGGVALAEVLGFRLPETIAWLTYRAAYLSKLVGTKSKILVLVTLLLERIFEPDIGAEGPEGEKAVEREGS